MKIRNNIQRTELAIINKEIGEPVMRFRVYSTTTSERHLLAGADYSLCMSAETREAAQQMISSHYMNGLDNFVIIDGDIAMTTIGEQA